MKRSKFNILSCVIILCFFRLDSFAQKSIFRDNSLYGTKQDTCVVILDRSIKYVEYKEEYIAKEKHKDEKNTSILGKIGFTIYIKSNHFSDMTFMNSPSYICFMKAFKGNTFFPIKYSDFKIKKSKLNNYRVVTTEQLHKISSQDKLNKVIGLFPTEYSIVYLVFKSDLKNEYIRLHRLIVMCDQVQI